MILTDLVETCNELKSGFRSKTVSCSYPRGVELNMNHKSNQECLICTESGLL